MAAGRGGLARGPGRRSGGGELGRPVSHGLLSAAHPGCRRPGGGHPRRGRALAGEHDEEPDADTYRPAPTPRWWKLHGEARGEALARLRAWVGQIYRPSYGHLAAALGSCWDQHPLCLYGLDWLMELWSTLYLTDDRNPPLLASQAEWQTRLLPALAQQMHLETTRCQHHQREGTGAPPRPGSV